MHIFQKISNHSSKIKCRDSREKEAAKQKKNVEMCSAFLLQPPTCKGLFNHFPPFTFLITDLRKKKKKKKGSSSNERVEQPSLPLSLNTAIF